MAEDIPESGDSKANLVPCSNCGRTFLDDRIETHKNICTNHKNREVSNEEKELIDLKKNP